MREWQAADIDKIIAKKMPEIVRSVLNQNKKKNIRRRPRNKGEQNVLDLLCTLRWQKALVAGKIKIINKREWYIEFD